MLLDLDEEDTTVSVPPARFHGTEDPARSVRLYGSDEIPAFDLADRAECDHAFLLVADDGAKLRIGADRQQGLDAAGLHAVCFDPLHDFVTLDAILELDEGDRDGGAFANRSGKDTAHEESPAPNLSVVRAVHQLLDGELTINRNVVLLAHDRHASLFPGLITRFTSKMLLLNWIINHKDT